MQSIKLQLGCFLVILFIEITYLRESRREHFSYNRQFELLMLTAPFAVFFDRLTAWTVNHLDIVPGYLNRLAHLFFFIWMDLTIIITSEYMYDQLIGFHKASKKDRLLLELPGAVSLLLIIAGIGELDYIQGVFHGIFGICMLWDSSAVLWHDSISGFHQAPFSAEGKSNQHPVLYFDCRSDTCCSDPLSRGTAYLYFSNGFIAWNLSGF